MNSQYRVLVWFSCHRDYFRFRLAEITSLANLSGVLPEQLWSGSNDDVDDPASKASIFPHYGGDVCLKRQKIIDYSYYGSSSAITFGDDESVFVFLNLPFATHEKVAREIIGRTVLAKGIAEIWAHGPSYKSVLESLKSNPNPRINDYITPSKSFSFLVDSFGRHLTQEEQIDRMGRFSFLFSGMEKANLNNPDVHLVIFEKWARLEQSAEPVLQHVYFGRSITHRPKGVPWWWKYRLSIRPVLGPTTMDNELAFIMANQAQLKPGMIVLDPFCGTGGLLISASHFGGMCFGADIDSRVLKGWGVCQLNKNIQHPAGATSDIFQNFKEYNLTRPEIVRMDTAAWTGFQRTRIEPSNVRMRPWVDVIITDPPYGIRASVREVTTSTANSNGVTLPSEKLNCTSLNIETKAPFIPPTSISTVCAMIEDLMHLASSLLVDNGRLVFLLPVEVTNVEKALESLKYPSFFLESASLQELSAGMGRVLVTMRRQPRALSHVIG